jgi:hypothetical protein
MCTLNKDVENVIVVDKETTDNGSSFRRVPQASDKAL